MIDRLIFSERQVLRGMIDMGDSEYSVFGNTTEELSKTVSPRAIRSLLCQSNALIEDGYFYLPDGLTNGRQMYRKVSTSYNATTHLRELQISSSWYYNDGGQFVIGGVDTEE